MRRVLFIGGPGNLSAPAAAQVLERGLELAIFTLPESPAGGLESRVRFFRGNRDDTVELQKAVAAFRPDAVVDFVCFRPEQAAAAAQLLAGAVEQYVFVSTVDAYGYPLSRLPMRESDPLGTPVGGYAGLKRECEDVLASAAAEGLPLTVVRPSYSFGPDFLLAFISYPGASHFVPRLRAGLPILVPGDGTTLMHPGCAANAGRMIGWIAASTASVGKRYNIAHDTFTTHDEYVRTIARVVGVEPRLVHVPTDLLLALGSPEVDTSVVPTLHRFNLAFSVEQFRADFPRFTWEVSIEEGIAEHLAHAQHAGAIPAECRPAVEDRIVELWQRHAERIVAEFQGKRGRL